VDSKLHGKELNPGITFYGGGVSLWISLLIDMGIISFYLLAEKMCICIYVYIIVNTISSCGYKAP